MKRILPILSLLVVTWFAGSAHAQSLPVTHNLQLWFNADVGVTVDGSGINVTRWADQSGNGNDATQVALNPSLQPDYVPTALNGHAVLRFDGGSDHLLVTNTAVNLTNGLSIFIVARNAERKNYNGLFRLGPSGDPFTSTSSLEIYWNDSGGSAFSGNSVYTANRTTPSFSFVGGGNPPVVLNKYYLYDVLAVSSAVTQRVNSVDQNGGFGGDTFFVPASTNNGFAAIGVGYGGDPAGDLRGDIAEILVYNTALNTTERLNVEAYLDGKYSLGIPEPSLATLLALSAVLLLRGRGTS